VTLLPLIFAILLGAVLATTCETARHFTRLENFAATYDQYFPPMELSSDGVLSVKGELKAPVRVPMFGAESWWIRPGATKPETVNAEGVIGLITDKSVVQFYGPLGFARHAITELAAPPYGFIKLPEKGQAKPINGQAIGAWLDNKLPLVVIGAGVVAVMQGMGEALWAGLMMFMICPVIMLAAAARVGGGSGGGRTLIMPRRAAYRMAAGILVPLVMVGALLRALGHPIAETLTPQGALFFWFIAALVLAVWTGLMAKRMYGPQKANG